jgi:DnaJ family protein C protein 28
MEKSPRSLDEQIRQAIKDGAFDNLTGKGKPLNLEKNPHEDPAWRMAFRVLRSGGHTLPWIEARRGIEADFEAAQKSLARSWSWRNSALDQNISYLIVEEEWQRAFQAYKHKIADLNQRIFNYNLEVPADQLKRLKINPDREIAKITKPVD